MAKLPRGPKRVPIHQVDVSDPSIALLLGGEPLAYKTVQGSLTQVKCNLKQWRMPPSNGGSSPKTFSRKARMRMLTKLATIDMGAMFPVQFVTLTYRDEWPIDNKRARCAMSLFFRHMECQYGKVPAIWRREWVDRKSGEWFGQLMPHFHMLILGSETWFEEDVASAWRKANMSTLAARVDVQTMENEKQCCYYVAKYCAKVESPSPLVNGPFWNRVTGRHWGYRRPNLFRYHAKTVMPLWDRFELAQERERAKAIWATMPDRMESTWTLFENITTRSGDESDS